MDYGSYFDLMKGSFTIIILIICSIISLKVVIQKYISFRGLQGNFLRSFADSINLHLKDGNYTEALSRISSSDEKWLSFRIKNPLKSILTFMIERNDYTQDELLQASYTRLDNEVAELEKGLGILATLGAVSPFIGLFGTVVGIIRAFSALSVNEAASYNNVMYGIAEALISTAAGILVAIPAVAFYNYFIKRIKLNTPVMEEVIMDTLHTLKNNVTVK